MVENFNRNHARQLVLRLQAAEIVKVPETIAEMEVYRQWTDPLLIALLEKSEHDPARKLRASLALLASDPAQANYLSGRFIDATPAELSVLCEFLADRGAALSRNSGRFWKRTARMTDESWVYRPRWLTSIAIARNGRVPQAGSARHGFRESDRRE